MELAEVEGRAVDAREVPGFVAVCRGRHEEVQLLFEELVDAAVAAGLALGLLGSVPGHELRGLPQRVPQQVQLFAFLVW